MALNGLKAKSFIDSIALLNSKGFIGLLTSLPKAIAGLISLSATFGFAQVKALGLKGALDLLNINPIILAISTLIAVGYGAIKLVDALTTSLKEHREQLESLKAEYSDIISEISALNSELETTQNRIKELKGFDTLSFADAQELKELQKTNNELERKINLLRQEEEIKQAEVNKKFVETMDADAGKGNEKQSLNRTLIETTHSGDFYAKPYISEAEYVNENIIAYEEAKAKFDQAIIEGDEKTKEIAQKSMDEIYEYLSGKNSEWAIASEGVEYIKNPTTEDEKAVNDWLDFIYNFQDRMAIATAKANDDDAGISIAKLDAFKRVSDKDEFSGIVDEIKSLGDDVDLTDEKFQSYLQALIDCGFISDTSSDNLQDVIDAINKTETSAENASEQVTSLSNTFKNLSTAKDDISSLSSAFKELSSDGSVSFSTLSKIQESFAGVQGIEKYIDALSRAKGNTQETANILSELTYSALEDAMGSTESLANANEALVASMLKENGVLNANEIAIYAVARAKEQDAMSSAYAQGGISGLIGYLNSATNASGVSKNALVYLAAQIVTTGNTTLSLEQQCNEVRRLAIEAYGASSAMASILTSAAVSKYMLSNHVSADVARKALLGQAMDRLKDEMDKVSALMPTYTGGGGGAGGGGATTDPIEEQSKAFKEQNKILEHQLFLLEQREGTELEQVELQKKIQEQLHQQAEWYRAQGVDENSDYLRDLSESWWKYEKSIQDIYDDIAKAAQESAKKQLEAQKEALEAQKEALEIQKDNFETAIDYYVGLIDKEIDALEAEKEAIQDRYDAQIDALKETNSELDNQIEREKLLSNLAKAKSTQKLVYKDGKYQYVSNVQAISEAQQALNEFDRQRKLEREVAALERARDAEVKAIDDQIKAWQDYAKEWKNIVNDYQNSQNKLIAEQVLGISLEKLNWDTRLQNAQDFVTKYNSIMSQIKAVEQQEQALVAGTDSDTYTDSTDWSQTWKDADARYKSGEYSKEQADAIKDYAHEQKTSEMQGSGKTYNPTSGEWYANGTTSASGGLSMVGERGAELRVLNKGDGIIPHNITENLMALGKYSPTNLMNKLSSVGSGSNVYQYSFDKLVLPNVSDANSFVKALQNFKPMAIQAGSSR